MSLHCHALKVVPACSPPQNYKIHQNTSARGPVSWGCAGAMENLLDLKACLVADSLCQMTPSMSQKMQRTSASNFLEDCMVEVANILGPDSKG